MYFTPSEIAGNDRLAAEGKGVWVPQDSMQAVRDGDPAPSSPNVRMLTYEDALLAGHGWQPTFGPRPRAPAPPPATGPAAHHGPMDAGAASKAWALPRPRRGGLDGWVAGYASRGATHGPGLASAPGTSARSIQSRTRARSV